MGLPEIVQLFIVKYIHSVDQLEILLLLRQDARKDWTAAEVARHLFTQPDVAGARLAELAKQQLLAEKPGDPAKYHYDPQTVDLQRAVNELAVAYPKYRVSIINLIFSKPIDKIRTFADAFRLKKEDDE